ncbi:decoy of host sigma70 [Cronobacter phage vB_CsaM_GAP161]|uniref:Postulated decoy of host sigma70 or sigmaS n=1 Tax=Cronobacter phage vB_CsaM_GAP161 TaxID=1141138 RepID=K4F7D0_9CAUD|nr:decoy of host sigma70 [Cronobacter phage vB_CsaM_GAP161]AFC22341.1 postulated decoy of host sigma70 or sigmaS [Cronobacter phage vB_CsaM_GAP161]
MSSMMNRWSGVITSTIKKDLVKVETKPKPVESETVSQKKVQTLVSLDPAELEHRRRAKQIEFDLRVARSYNSKNDDARNRNLQFALTLSDWAKLMSEPVCSYSGRPFSNKGGCSDSRTMERINASLGYTVENTIAVTSAANSEKSNLDAFMKGSVILPEVKLKLLRKAAYQIEKQLKIKG